MPKVDRCPRCSHKVPYAAGRCVGCGAGTMDPVLFEHRRRNTRRTAAIVITALAVAALLAMNYSDRYAPAVSDWYMRMVIPYAPDVVVKLAPIPEDERAFYACARSIARRIGEQGSIVTFPGSGAAVTVSLGNGRYRVQSYVDESTEMGNAQRHAFTCMIRAERDRWVLEELNVRALDDLRGRLAATAP